MIYTKRQSRMNSDHYGGFAKSEDVAASTLTADRPADVAEEKRVPAADTTSRGNVFNELIYGSIDDKLTYAEPEKEKDPVRRESAEDDLYSTRGNLKQPTAAKPTRKLEHADVMPTVQTLKYAGEEQNVELENSVPVQRQKRAALDSRTKILLLVYTAIAVVLAVAVIATGITISHVNSDAQELVNTIVQKQETIAAQEARLSELTDEATIRDEAVNSGMVYSEGSSATAGRIDKIDYPEATPHTNGFDKFCDWLSNI